MSLTGDHGEVHPLRQICQDSSKIIISNQIGEVMWADGLIHTVRLLTIITGNLNKGKVTDINEAN